METHENDASDETSGLSWPTVVIIGFTILWIALIVYDVTRSCGDTSGGLSEVLGERPTALDCDPGRGSYIGLGTIVYFFLVMVTLAYRGVARRQEATRLATTGITGRRASSVDDLASLADLRDRGVLTDSEFEAKKAALLARSD